MYDQKEPYQLLSDLLFFQTVSIEFLVTPLIRLNQASLNPKQGLSLLRQLNCLALPIVLKIDYIWL